MAGLLYPQAEAYDSVGGTDPELARVPLASPGFLCLHRKPGSLIRAPARSGGARSLYRKLLSMLLKTQLNSNANYRSVIYLQLT